MTIRRYSCFAPGRVVHTPPFDAMSYSAFKFGSYSALTYQTQLMDELIRENLPGIDPQEWAISSAAYKRVPTASTLLTQNLEICNRVIAPLQPVHIERNYVYPEDYAKLSKKERNDRLGSVELFFPTYQLIGKKLIVVDDAYVTGAHEENIVRQVGPYVEEMVFLYLVDLSASPSADVESKINYTALHSIKDLEEFVLEGNYKLNARTIKYLLAYPDPLGFYKFLYQMDGSFALQLYKASIADGYAAMKPFATNMRIVSQAMIDNPTVFVSNYARAHAGVGIG